VSNSASKVSGALEKAITLLSKSAAQQQQEHALQYLNSDHSLSQVLWVGLKQTGQSLLGSATNVVKLPIEGWRKQGKLYFFFLMLSE